MTELQPTRCVKRSAQSLPYRQITMPEDEQMLESVRDLHQLLIRCHNLSHFLTVWLIFV
jgi:hypothetical protein